MGGGKKRQLQDKAEKASGDAASLERDRAAAMQTQLGERKAALGEGLAETTQKTRLGAENLRDTGGFDPKTFEPIRAGYTDLATTGGFNPGEKEQFLRRSTAPVAAMYGRGKDELSRRLSVQGGYNPGFDASSAKMTRQGANAGADASLNANVELAGLVRSGKQAGMAGQTQLAGMEQQGKVAGQDALQRYSTNGANALTDLDTSELRNRLQSGQMSQADAQLLAALASQHKDLFDKVMQGISTVGGAVAGLGAAF